MCMRIDYRTTDLQPYINWVYFFHAWGVPPKSSEAMQLKQEAERVLATMRPHVVVKCVVDILPAFSDEDDIVVGKTYLCECGQCHATGETVRLPMLRQQTPGSDGFCLCLSDFIKPKQADTIQSDRMGVFATSVAATGFEMDDQLMNQTLQDRLAEAAAEKLHEEVRRRIWGYAPNEDLTIEQLHKEAFQGIRPAVGYPCLPDISLNFILDKLLNLSSIGIELTGHGMMQPHASVSGLMISHPQSRYFSVGKVDDTQLADYAKRRGMSVEETKKYLAANTQY